MVGQLSRSRARGFVVMPFGRKPNAKGEEIDFDLVYRVLIAPALEDCDIDPVRADLETRAGGIHTDMFQDLLLADVVVADLTIDNPNVFYELGVRHALRDNATVGMFTGRERLPFDVVGERMVMYSPVREPLDEAAIASDRTRLAQMLRATLAAWRGRRASPVYRLLPNLEEPQWKRLKVGDVNEYWQKLEAWELRVATARSKQRPGDVLLLADETPNRMLELEALKAAAKALVALGSVQFAVTVLDQALALDAEDLWLQQQRALALGRAGRYAEARTILTALAKTHRDSETLGLLARTHKDHWVQLWCGGNDDPAARLQKAKASTAALECAAESYVKAFQLDPAGYYPGINALTLGHLWQHLTGRTCKLDLALITQGLRWAIDCALKRQETECGYDYWDRVTRGELRLVADADPGCLDDYEAALATAVSERDRFAVDSTRQQVDLMWQLGFRPDITAPVRDAIARAEEQLAALMGPRPARPEKVVLFSGHMIDDPKTRGADAKNPPRFPAAKADAARTAIATALERLGAGRGHLALCGGACGGDLLFAEAALARGMHVELRLARRQPEFLAESVTFADADRRWYESFRRVTGDPATLTLEMPGEVGPTPEGVSVHDRNNRWQLYTALSHGLECLEFIALWDGKAGDGPGGTKEMIERIRQLTGRAPIIIDPAAL